MTHPDKLYYANHPRKEPNRDRRENFDQALLATYTDMAADVTMIRKLRAEYRKRAMEQQHKG